MSQDAAQRADCTHSGRYWRCPACEKVDLDAAVAEAVSKQRQDCHEHMAEAIKERDAEIAQLTTHFRIVDEERTALRQKAALSADAERERCARLVETQSPSLSTCAIAEIIRRPPASAPEGTCDCSEPNGHAKECAIWRRR